MNTFQRRNTYSSDIPKLVKYEFDASEKKIFGEIIQYVYFYTSKYEKIDIYVTSRVSTFQQYEYCKSYPNVKYFISYYYPAKVNFSDSNPICTGMLYGTV